MQSVLALTVAALGALYKRASSPNASPELYVFKYVSLSPVFYFKIIIQIFLSNQEFLDLLNIKHLHFPLV